MKRKKNKLGNPFEVYGIMVSNEMYIFNYYVKNGQGVCCVWYRVHASLSLFVYYYDDDDDDSYKPFR